MLNKAAIDAMAAKLITGVSFLSCCGDGGAPHTVIDNEWHGDARSCGCCRTIKRGFAKREKNVFVSAEEHDTSSSKMR